jgi:tetratricopeptide (TPR) repeat protein
MDEASERAAKKACAVGDYQKGIDILADLLIETNDPTYIYNQGRCYQQNGHFVEALNRFHEYLRKASLRDDARGETERQIADCEAALVKAAQFQPSPAAPPALAAPSPAHAPVPQSEAPIVATKETRAPATSGHRSMRIAGIVCAAGGLAALGAGVGLALKTQSLSEGTAYSRKNENERASLETLGWISYGVSAAALATGTILYLLGSAREPGEQSSALVQPVLRAGGGSVVLNGRF